ncbi:MAG TPA: sulfatase-like hydrolase/transferase [Planctomycetia bacterium]|nr:sulfatase-like hydrolase/transferase [Planctomycetia bacterium]
MTFGRAAPSHKNPKNFVRNGKAVGPREGFSAPLVAEEAIDWLRTRRDKSKPFYLQVWTHEPHLPIESDPRFQAPYADLDDDHRQHHGNVSQLDEAFGRLMKALDDEKAAENTFVFFTSDNGPEGDGLKGRSRGSSGGLRGRKRSMYEGGIRVPGIARWPGRIQPGTTADGPVIGSDLFPTILGICGVEPPADRTFDGVDARPLLEGKVAALARKAPLYWRLRMAPDNLHLALRDGDWKAVAAEDWSKFEIYNLKVDPNETTDLKSREPERAKELESKLRAMNAEVEKEGPDWWKRLTADGARDPKSVPPKKNAKGKQ